MKKHPLQTAIETFNDSTRSYSGRAMYGKDCLGVVIPQDGLGELVANIVDHVINLASEARDANDDEADDEFLDCVSALPDALRKLRTDNMGYDTIVYFPGVPFSDDDTDEEEDEEDEEEDQGADSQNTKTLIAMGR